MINKILNWKANFKFNERDNPDSGKVEYWWIHNNGAKSGELFETLEEAELSALIYFCKEYK
jgi:hypothetical protein